MYTEDYEKILRLLQDAEVVAVDTEGTDGKKTDIRSGTGFSYGISVAFKSGSEIYSSYFPVAHTQGNVSDKIKQDLVDLLLSRPTIVFHNAKYDLEAIRTISGCELLSQIKNYYDTMLMAHMINENWPSKQLDWLSKTLLKKEGKAKPPIWQFWIDCVGWSPDFPADVMGPYSGMDTELTLLLFFFLYPEFKKQGFDG